MTLNGFMKMIWIKSNLIFVLLGSICFVCKQEETTQVIKSGVPKFFDLKSYFKGEVKSISSKISYKNSDR
jgi:hypothetical protein